MTALILVANAVAVLCLIGSVICAVDASRSARRAERAAQRAQQAARVAIGQFVTYRKGVDSDE